MKKVIVINHRKHLGKTLESFCNDVLDDKDIYWFYSNETFSSEFFKCVKCNEHKTIFDKKIFYPFRFFYHIEMLNSKLIYKKLNKEYKRLLPIIEKINPTLCICLDDRSADFNQVILKICSDKNIKVVVPYFSYSSGEGVLKQRQRSKSFLLNENWYKRLLK